MIGARVTVGDHAVRVLLVGLGGIGCPAALALLDGAARDPRLRERLQLGLLDDDRVAASNLQRQILYRDADVGRPKVEAACDALARRHRFIATRLEPIQARFDDRSAPSLLARFDLLIDGTDSVAGKLALNRAAVAARVPLVHAGAVRWQGQLLVVRPGGPCLACLFDALPGVAAATEREVCDNACATQGVVGPAVGVVGALAGERALGLLGAGAKDAAVEELLVFDGLAGRFSSLRVARDPACAVCGDARARGAA